MELETQEREEGSSISKKVVKAIVIGASLVGLGFVLRRFGSLQSHTIPPIVIKSIDDDSEPIEVESRTTLVENQLQEQAGPTAVKKVYTMSGFGITRYVKILRTNRPPGAGVPPIEYKNNLGLEVKVWLQHKHGGGWVDEPNGPHLVVAGTMADFPLTSDQLSRDKPNGNPSRPRKRSYNKNKNWRIGAVQVGNDKPISTNGFTEVAIAFENHFH